MLEQNLIRSGFDIEILLGEEFLTYVLLTLTDSGTIPVAVNIDDPPVEFLLCEPDDADRNYDLNPDAVQAKADLDCAQSVPCEQLAFDPTCQCGGRDILTPLRPRKSLDDFENHRNLRAL